MKDAKNIISKRNKTIKNLRKIIAGLYMENNSLKTDIEHYKLAVDFNKRTSLK